MILWIEIKFWWWRICPCRQQKEGVTDTIVVANENVDTRGKGPPAETTFELGTTTTNEIFYNRRFFEGISGPFILHIKFSLFRTGKSRWYFHSLKVNFQVKVFLRYFGRRFTSYFNLSGFQVFSIEKKSMISDWKIDWKSYGNFPTF